MKKKTGLLLLFLILCLCACGRAKEKDTGDSAPGTDLLLTTADSAVSYTIIYPGALSGDSSVVKACQEISDLLAERTGTVLPVATDSQLISDCEVLIGETNRPESADTAAGLTAHQYRIKAVNDKLVITGGSNEALLNAIGFFRVNMLLNTAPASPEFSIPRDTDLFFDGTEGASAITLMGVPITEDLMIIHPEIYIASERRLAYYLAQQIFLCTGIRPGVTTDSSEAAGTEILVGNTNRTTASIPTEHSFVVSGEGGKLQVLANSMFAYNKLTECIAQELFNTAYPQISIGEAFRYGQDISGEIRDGSLYADERQGEYRVFFQNVFGNSGNTGDFYGLRYPMTVELCQTYNADVLGFQEFDPQGRDDRSWSSFNNLLSSIDYTEIIPENFDSGSRYNYTPLFYREDRLELLESSYHLYTGGALDASKSFTSAVFKHRTTGESFAVINTHYHHGKEAGAETRILDSQQILEEMARLTDSYGKNLPIIMGGDLNCKVGTDPLNMLLEAGCLSAAHSAIIAENLDTHHAKPEFSADYKNFITYTMPTAGYEEAIDHIFVQNAEAMDLNLFEVITDPYSLLTSDHCAIFVDFNVK